MSINAKRGADHASPSVATGPFYAMRAMRPNSASADVYGDTSLPQPLQQLARFINLDECRLSARQQPSVKPSQRTWLGPGSGG